MLKSIQEERRRRNLRIAGEILGNVVFVISIIAFAIIGFGI